MSAVGIKLTGFEPISDAISAVAGAIAERDKAIDKAINSTNEKYVAWAESELQLRRDGNDVLTALGAPLRAIAKLIGKIDPPEG